MAPKGRDQPKAAKVAIDKTFGMKNKKGGAAQKHIKQLEASTASKSDDQKRKDALKEAKAKELAAAEQARKEAAELFKPVQVQKVPIGVDPKSVLCQFFKKGACEKGKRCKFSHDLAIERKAEKKGLYDTPEGEEKEKADAEQEAKMRDDMANWDEEKLKSVVLSKQGNAKTTTDKVCKFFIEAVENGKYGWFWTCPNGGTECKYRHTLPPGFVLKTREQRLAEKAAAEKSAANQLTLEDFLETERQKLSGTLTPVTPESFAKWKKERMDKKAAEEELRRQKEETGRALFESGDYRAESGDEDDDDDGGFNLAALRRETERIRNAKEQERLAKEYGMEYVEQVQEPPDEDAGSSDNDDNGSSGNDNGNGEGSSSATS